MNATTCLHESRDGRVSEYRRVPSPPAVLRLECRLLRPDGRPHGDGWYPVTDAQLLFLGREGTGILDELAAA